MHRADQAACPRQRLLWLTAINLLRDHDWVLHRGEAATPLAHLQAALASANASAPSLLPVVVVWRGAGSVASRQPWLEEDAIAAVQQLGAVVVRRDAPYPGAASWADFGDIGPDTKAVAPALLLSHLDLPDVIAEVVRSLPEAVSSTLDPALMLWTDPYVLFTGDVSACALQWPRVWSCSGCTVGGPEAVDPASVGVAVLNVTSYGHLRSQHISQHAASSHGGAKGVHSDGHSVALAVLSALLPHAGDLPPSLHYQPQWGMPQAAAPEEGRPCRPQPASSAATTGEAGRAIALPGITLLRTRHPPLHHALCALNQAAVPARSYHSHGSALQPHHGGRYLNASLQLALEHCCLDQGCGTGTGSNNNTHVASTLHAMLAAAVQRDGAQLVRATAALFEQYSELAQRALQLQRPTPTQLLPYASQPSTNASILRQAQQPYEDQEYIAARNRMRGLRVLLLAHAKGESGGTLVVVDLAQALIEAGARVDMASIHDGDMHDYPATRLGVLRVMRRGVNAWTQDPRNNAQPGSGSMPGSGVGPEYEYSWFNPHAYDAIVANTRCMDDLDIGGYWMRHQVEAYGEAFTSRLVWWLHEAPGDWFSIDTVVRRIAASGLVPIRVAGHKVSKLWCDTLTKYAQEAMHVPEQPPAHFGVVHPMLSHDLVRSALVGPEERAAHRARVRNKILGGLPDTAVVVLSVGRFDPHDMKGLHGTLDAMDKACVLLVEAGSSTRGATSGPAIGGVAPAAAAAACPHAVFVAGGPGNFAKNTNATLKALPPDHVHVLMTPPKDVIQSLYHGADIFVMNSRAECFTRVLMEALSCSLPAIANANAGDTELVLQHRVSGLLHHSPNATDVIAKHIVELMPTTPGGASLSASLGAAGRALVLGKYHPVHQLAKWFRLIHRAGKRGQHAEAADEAKVAAAAGGSTLPMHMRQRPRPVAWTGSAGGYGMLSRFSVPPMPIWTRRDMVWAWQRQVDAPAEAVGRGMMGVRLRGSIFVFGGLAANGTGKGRQMWRLNLEKAAGANTNSAWSPAAQLPDGMGVAAITAVPHMDRLMYLAGGVSMAGKACVVTAGLYDAAADAWRDLPLLPAALCGAATVVDPATHVLHVLKGTTSMLAKRSQDDDNRYSHLTLQLQPNGMPAPGSAWRVEAPAPPDAMARHTVVLPLYQQQHIDHSSAPDTDTWFGDDVPAAANSTTVAAAVQLLGGCYAGSPVANAKPAYPFPAFAPPWRLHECTLDPRPSHRVNLQEGAGPGTGAAAARMSLAEWVVQPSPLPLPLQHMCGVVLRDGTALLAGGANARSWVNGFVYAYDAQAHAVAAVGYLPQGPTLAPVCAVWQGRLWVLLGEKSARRRTVLGQPSAEVWSVQLPEGLVARTN